MVYISISSPTIYCINTITPISNNMCRPKIFYFGDEDRLAPQVYNNIDAQYEIILTDKDDLKNLRKANNGHLAIIEHAPYANESFDILSTIKGIKHQLPVILLAKNPSKTDLIQAMRLGANDIFMLSDPIEDLLARIEQYSEPPSQGLKARIIRFFEVFLAYLEGLFANAKKIKPSPNTLNIGMPIPALSTPVALKKDNELKVNILDGFSMTYEGEKIKSIKSKKASALWSYLLLNHRKKINRDNLMTTFWEDSASESAKNCLHVTICALRKHFATQIPAKDIILYQDGGYSLNPDLNITLDVTEFKRYWKQANKLESADNMEEAIVYYEKAYTFYNSDFLQEISLENWVEAEREHLRETYLIILDRLSWYYYNKEKYEFARRFCREALKKDDCLEDIHARLMCCYAKLGQRASAIRQYQKCVEILDKELDISPSPTTVELFEKIKRNQFL